MLRTMLGPVGATEVQHLDLQEEGKKESSLCVYHSFGVKVGGGNVSLRGLERVGKCKLKGTFRGSRSCH